jgi:hypothetical protein
VQVVRFGKGERLTDKASQALSKGIVEALGMVGQAGFLTGGLVLRLGDDGAVRCQKSV